MFNVIEARKRVEIYKENELLQLDRKIEQDVLNAIKSDSMRVCCDVKGFSDRAIQKQLIILRGLGYLNVSWNKYSDTLNNSYKNIVFYIR